MLSKQFDFAVKKILSDKLKAFDHEFTIPKYEPWKIYTSYDDIFLILPNLAYCIDNSETCTFNNKVSNGILSCNVLCNAGSKYNPNYEIPLVYLSELECIDSFSQGSKDKIKQCLDALDINCVINDDFYDQIDGKKLYPHGYSCHFEAIVLQLHFKVMMQKIFFVWENDQTGFKSDIQEYEKIVSKYAHNFTQSMYSYNTASFLMYYVFDLPLVAKNIKELFKFLESLVEDYKNIRIIQ